MFCSSFFADKRPLKVHPHRKARKEQARRMEGCRAAGTNCSPAKRTGIENGSRTGAPCGRRRKEIAMLDPRMTLEKRIAAELYAYHGKMSVYADDLHGHTVMIAPDEHFETASTIKTFILAVLLFSQSR